MTTDEEIAEARRLEAEISQLISRINHAQDEQVQLEQELIYCVEQLEVLDGAAQRMSANVNKDLDTLNGKIGHEDVDARDLLQLIHDVSDKYFSYKNLSTATKNLTQFNDEYYTKFKFYHELRRIALGCVMAVDSNLISQETTRKQVEKSYLANTDYWLAYAIAAVMLWWSNEPEAAVRAQKRAMLIAERKSSLFFLFVNLKFGRKESAARWYAYYLRLLHANDVGEEFQYLLEAQLSGAFGNSRELEMQVSSQVNAMFDEITLYSINFKNEVADAANRFMQTKAHTTDFEFFYLPEYCEQQGQMKDLISDAEKNLIVAREYQQIAQEPVRVDDVDERLEDSIYNVIESMDPQEEKLYRRIRYNELIVAAKGDIHKAETAYAERYPDNDPIGFGGLLKRWAFTEDDTTILPQTRRFAVEKLEPQIRSGFAKFAEGYRAKESERYTIAVDGWSMSCNENEADIAKANYEQYYSKHSLVNYLKDKFIIIWMAMIGMGLLGLVLSAVVWQHPAPIVVSMLLVLIGGFCLWRQIDNLKVLLEKRKQKSLEIIERTLAEMGRWRQAYKEVDQNHQALIETMDLFKQ